MIKSYAQYSFRKTDSVQVFLNSGKKLQLAFAGGFNYMQFSEIDLNDDGVKDLFAFDRSSNKITTFLNNNIPDSVSYTYAPEYGNKFPKDLQYWALLYDYNCDGKTDIFTQSTGAIRVYTNDGNGTNGLHFTSLKNKIYSKYNATDSLPLYVTSVDIPAITDVDLDGDLDIVTFSANSYYVEFHKNYSKERYASYDSLEFELETHCFGNFKEDQNNCDIYLNQPCFNKKQQESSENERDINHSGSSVLAFDIDDDHDKDLLISDISCSNIKEITNGGDSSLANATSIDINYPSYNTPVSMSVFPCPFLVDVNNDGKKDLLCSPNASTGSENKKSVVYYENTSPNNSYQFNYVKNNFLQDEMIENGEGAYPTFFDYNSDGLQDLILGNTGRFQTGELRAQLMLFQNIGTSSYPKYKLIDDDFLNFSAQPSINFLVCTFGDLDTDGDKDMIIGNGNGELMYYENNPVAGISNFILADANYEGIDVGYNAAPQIIDLNRDGLLDIIIGTSTGRIKYYKNIGNAQVAQFVQETSGLGDVFTGITGGTVLTDGYCTPHIFDLNGSYQLLCGSKTGRIFRYNNIEGNLTGSFNKVDTNYLSIWEGRNSSIAISDINNDGQIDMMIGNISGGLNYYSGDITGSINDIENKCFIKIYPNPVNDEVNIVCDEIIQHIIISDIEGREIITSNFNSTKKATIATDLINPGIYFIKVVHHKGYNQSKIIITK